MYMMQPRIDHTTHANCTTFVGTGGHDIYSSPLRVEGTGSIYDIANIDKWRYIVQKTTALIIEIQKQHSRKIERDANVDIRSATEHLANIRRVFNPAISDLANAFGVSRQAIYKWIGSESKPEQEKFACIKLLSQTADEFNNADISRAPAMLKMKAFNGQSLLDLVASGQMSQEHVRTLVSEAKTMEDAYNRSGLARTAAPVSDDWRNEISIPGSPE